MGPFAVVAEEKSALRLFSLNEAALEEGLAEGMALTDARAVLPALKTKVAEPERESVRDDVHLVAAAGQLLAELRRHRARTPDRGVAHDAELHSRTT